MADPTETVETPGTETEPPESTETPQHERLPDDHPAAVALKKANDEAAKLRTKVKEFEDADKSEIERATGKVAELEKGLTEQTLRADRLEVALDKGLTLTQAKRLVGSTKEELEADADELLAEFPPTETPGSKLPKRPKARGGDKPAEEPKGKERAAAALRGMRDTR